MLVLSKKIIINFVKTKSVRGKWRKHDTRGSMAPFSHLLRLAYGLYMTTANLLNGHLHTECFFNCSHFIHTSANMSSHNLFLFSCQENICPKMLPALKFIVCCLYSPSLQTIFDLMKTNIDP